MATTLTQADRFLKITTPLEDDKLMVRSFTGREEISRLFHFQLELISTDGNIDPKDLIGESVTLSVLQNDMQTERYFNGCISRFVRLPSQMRVACYRMEVVPWLWFLTRTSDCRIYQEQTVPQILEDLFQRYGFSDYEIKGIKGKHEKWDYCVQYRETGYNFVSRMMEQEGIFYFFRHEEEKHILVLADQKGIHKPCPYQSKVHMQYATGAGYRRAEDTVHNWEHHYEFRPGKWAQTDYNFETPGTSLMANTESLVSLKNNTVCEIYDYPGEHEDKDEGETLTRIRMEEHEVGYDVIVGESDCRSFTIGGKFTLEDHEREAENTTYVITSLLHRGTEGGYYSEEQTTESGYSNSFTCIPETVTYRPARTTPKPLVQGSQTAVVVGPKGEEIYTDKYGRVKVQFHWDRRGKYNEKSSCWVRVSYPWAGKNWGGVHIPRVGQEVIVDFLEGDPDCPIIIGRVYNAEVMPPYTLPNWQTYTTWKSNSYKGGGGYNEIRYYDKKGYEQIYMHCQKRMDVRVKEGYYDTCGAGRYTVVGGDYDILVYGDENIHIKGGLYECIDSLLNQYAKGDVVYDYHSNCATMVTGKFELNAREVIVEAKQQICLKVGGNFITIDPSGVTIYGTMVKINSGGYGTETGDPEFQDAQDAGAADTGEPGYLERYYSGGGGGGKKWKKRKLRSQHYVAPPRPGEDARMTAIRNTLANSATGRHALEVYDRYGITPTFNPGGTAYGGGVVNMDPSRTDPATSFVHEMNHAQNDKEHTSADVNDPNRAHYVDQQLQEDAHGERLAYQTQQELADAGHPETYNSITSPSYQRGYQDGVAAERARNPNATPGELDRAGHDAAEQRILDDYRNGRVTTGNTSPPQTYPQYWGQDWDNHHPGGGGAGGGH